MPNYEGPHGFDIGVKEWNLWRANFSNVTVDFPGATIGDWDLSGYNLSSVNFSGATLRRIDMSDANLRGASFRSADLRDVDLGRANLTRADLSNVNLANQNLAGANLLQVNAVGAQMGQANLRSANLRDSNFIEADLSDAILWQADLRGARFESARLLRAEAKEADATGAHFAESNLNGANLKFAKLVRTDLRGADLRTARLDGADMRNANLTGAALFRAGLNAADLSGATLTGADLRAALLLRANLTGCIANDVMLWETQRSGWKIKDIVCHRALWDEDAREPTAYEPGEFERLYSEQTVIELFYQGGVSTFELNTLPALLQHLASLHSDAHIRLKSIEETGGGAKISISVGDADADTAEKIKTDAMQVYHAQLLLRDNDLERLRIENRILTGQNDKLISALLTAGTQHNTFNAPVYGAALSSGSSSATVHQTLNDNQAILDLIQKLLDHIERLELPPADSARFESEADTVKAGLQKPAPDKTLLSRSLGFIQKIGADVLTKSAEKLGEQALSGDWRLWLDQLGQLVHHLK